jgi:hypothetical protein
MRQSLFSLAKPVNLCDDISRLSGDCRRRSRLAQGAVPAICGEQEFLAELKTEGYTC